MSGWFSNRGQVIQLVIATAAFVVGLLAAVKQDYIKVEYALFLVCFCVVALWLLLRRFEGQIARAIGGTEQSAVALPEKFTAKWHFETIKLRKGERWTDQGKKNEVRLVDVLSSPKGNVAVISPKAELNYFCAGADVKKRGSDFILPETSFHDQSSIIVSYTVAKTFVMCFSVRVEHINPHTGEAELVITKVDGAHL